MAGTQRDLRSIQLRALRRQAGLRTQRETAGFFGVTENTVYRWESGKVAVPKHIVRLLETQVQLQQLLAEAAATKRAARHGASQLVRQAMRAARIQAGRTQESLAKAANTSRSGIAHLERGRGEPSGQVLGAVLRALNPDTQGELERVPDIGPSLYELDLDGLRALVVLLLTHRLNIDSGTQNRQPIRRSRARAETPSSLQRRLL